MPRTFRTVESQREASRLLAQRLLATRLRRNGCSEAVVVAFTAQRLRRYPIGRTVGKAYDR